VASWRKNFSLLLNVLWVNDVRQTEIHTAEPLVLEPSTCKVEMTSEKPKSQKAPGIDQIQAEFINAGATTIRYEIHKLINSIWNKKELFSLKNKLFV
jgi:hypothetical protein